MNKTKTIRSLRELLNQIYLVYGMTRNLPDAIIGKIEKEITDTEPKIVERHVLNNDIVIKPELESNRCVHTEHCCRLHGCKYGDDDECVVANGDKSQSFPCESCMDDDRDSYYE